MNQLPLALTLLRLALAPVVVLLSVRPHPVLFGIVLTAAFLSDIFDGVLARRLGVATAFLRRLDSAVDIVFYLAVGVALWRLRPEVVRAHLLLVAAVVGLEVLRLAIERLKYGRKASYHLWSAKAWGIALFAGALALLSFDGGSFWFVLMLWPGVIENLEGLAVTALLPVWTYDVPTAFTRGGCGLPGPEKTACLPGPGSDHRKAVGIEALPTRHLIAQQAELPLFHLEGDRLGRDLPMPYHEGLGPPHGLPHLETPSSEGGRGLVGFRRAGLLTQVGEREIEERDRLIPLEGNWLPIRLHARHRLLPLAHLEPGASVPGGGT